MPYRFSQILITFLYCTLMHIPGYAADTTFSAGIEQFRQNNFEQAARLFQQSLDAGDRRATVYYNLAVSEYRLQRYDAAEAHLMQAATDNDYADLARYNIGLIYARRELYAEAITWFDKVTARSSIYSNARNMIRKIEQEPVGDSIIDGLSGIARVSYGYDDNVNLVTDNSPLNQSDQLINLYATLNAPIDDHIKLDVSFFMSDYDDIDTSDFDIWRARASVASGLSGWRTRLQLSHARSQLAGQEFQSSNRLALSFKRSVMQSGSLKLHYEYDDINSDDPLYDYLEGSRQRLRLSYRHRSGAVSIETRVRFETNDRIDTASRSHSPDRTTIRGILRYQPHRDWQLKADVSLRNSDYPSIAVNTGRHDDRQRVAVSAFYEIDRHWLLEGKHRYTSNDSDDASYVYHRNETTFSAYYRY